jgi:hypothetical protein
MPMVWESLVFPTPRRSRFVDFLSAFSLFVQLLIFLFSRFRFECHILCTFLSSPQLGEIVYVNLPEVGATASQGKGVSEVESVKACSAVYSPVDGTVTEVNTAVREGETKENDRRE